MRNGRNIPLSMIMSFPAITFGIGCGSSQFLQEITHACWDIFRLHGYARVDFRIDEERLVGFSKSTETRVFTVSYCPPPSTQFSHIFQADVKQLQED